MSEQELRDRYADVLEGEADPRLERLVRDLDAAYQAPLPAALLAPLVWHAGRRWPGTRAELAAVVLVLVVVLGGVALTRTGTPSPGATPPGPVLLLTQGGEVGTGRSGTPGWQGHFVDPVTLQDVPNRPVIPLGDSFSTVFSPDGHLVAVVSQANPTTSLPGKVRVVDLETGQDVAPPLTLTEMVVGVTFSPDSRSLYWLTPTRRERLETPGAPPYDAPRDWIVVRYDIATGKAQPAARLPISLSYWSAGWTPRLVDGGRRMAFTAYSLTNRDPRGTVPEVVVLDLETGAMTADVRLNGVPAGIWQADATVSAEDAPAYMPALAWDLERNLLYIVHAEADRVTVVDLRKGAVVAEADIRPRASLFDRLGRWLFPSAAAKGPMNERWAQLSPDGSRLYIRSARIDTSGETLGGVQVVDTRDFRRIAQFDAPVDGMALSPDGRILLVGTLRGPAARQQHRVLLLDAETLKELAYTDLDPFNAELSFEGFSADGRYAYVQVGRPNQTLEVQVLDLRTRRVVANRIAAGSGYWGVLVPRPEPLP